KIATAIGYPAVGNGSYFRRVPGYSLLYYAAVATLGYEHGHQFLKYFQTVLFGVTVYMMFGIIFYLTKKEKLSLFLTALYGVLPFCSGYVYFTTTEAISPVLIVFYVYFLLRAYTEEDPKRKIYYYIIANFFIGY